MLGCRQVRTVRNGLYHLISDPSESLNAQLDICGPSHGVLACSDPASGTCIQTDRVERGYVESTDVNFTRTLRMCVEDESRQTELTSAYMSPVSQSSPSLFTSVDLLFESLDCIPSAQRYAVRSHVLTEIRRGAWPCMPSRFACVLPI